MEYLKNYWQYTIESIDLSTPDKTAPGEIEEPIDLSDLPKVSVDEIKKKKKFDPMQNAEKKRREIVGHTLSIDEEELT